MNTLKKITKSVELSVVYKSNDFNLSVKVKTYQNNSRYLYIYLYMLKERRRYDKIIKLNNEFSLRYIRYQIGRIITNLLEKSCYYENIDFNTDGYYICFK